MKTFLTSGLVAATLAGAAFAQDAAVPVTEGPTVDLSTSANLVKADDLEDGNVYSLETGIESGTWGGATYTEVSPEWDDICDIEDLVLDSSGQLVAVVAEIGGFLDIGDRHVLLPVGDVRLVPNEEGRYSYVTRLSQQELEQLPQIEESFWD